MKSRVPIAIVGAGLIGRRHVDAISRSARAKVAALVDPAPAARVLAAAEGIPWYGDLSDLPQGLAGGVILATPNQMHVEGALACISRRLPVLIEKPLATDADGAARIVSAAEAAGIPALTGHHRRHNPLIAAARAQISGGAIGQVVSVHGMFWLRKPDDYFDLPWRREPGAGPVFLNLIHDIDLLRHLVGEVTAVQAVRSNAFRGHAVEETCVMMLEFGNSALGTVNVSDAIPAPWSWEFTAAENPAYPATDQACYWIGGTLGSLELPRGRLWYHAEKQGWWEPLSATIAPRESGDPLVIQADHFADVIAGRVAPLVSAREGMNTLNVTLAVQTAAREGRRVTLAG